MKLTETKDLRQYTAAGGVMHSNVNQRILDKLAQQEVIHCASAMMYELRDVEKFAYADDYMALQYRRNYEDAASEAGWIRFAHASKPQQRTAVKMYGRAPTFIQLEEDSAKVAVVSNARNVEDLCRDEDIEPNIDEVYEHWIVSQWLAKRLVEHGEVIGEVLGFTLWGRCTTGQAICMDYVIAEIAAEMGILEGQAHSWAGK